MHRAHAVRTTTHRTLPSSVRAIWGPPPSARKIRPCLRGSQHARSADHVRLPRSQEKNHALTPTPQNSMHRAHAVRTTTHRTLPSNVHAIWGPPPPARKIRLSARGPSRCELRTRTRTCTPRPRTKSSAHTNAATFDARRARSVHNNSPHRAEQGPRDSGTAAPAHPARKISSAKFVCAAGHHPLI